MHPAKRAALRAYTAANKGRTFPLAKPLAAPARPSRIALPCVHLGNPTGEIVACPSCSGNVRVKVMGCTKFGECTPEKQVAGKVCCASCPNYFPTKPGTILMPPPPPLRLTPQHPRAVVTVAVGPEAAAMLALTGPFLHAYAARLDADFVCLNWPGHPDWPMSCKFGIARALDHYERIAYLDVDTLPRPGCVDLFAACHPEEMGVCDELAWHRSQPHHGRERDYQQFRRRMGFPLVEHLPWMVNTGVMVVPRSHRDLLLPPTQPLRPAHCAEQDHINARLLASGLPYRLLDRRCNWQWWQAPGFPPEVPPEALLHFSGLRTDRLAVLRKWVESLGRARDSC